MRILKIECSRPNAYSSFHYRGELPIICHDVVEAYLGTARPIRKVRLEFRDYRTKAGIRISLKWSRGVIEEYRIHGVPRRVSYGRTVFITLRQELLNWRPNRPKTVYLTVVRV